MFWNCEVSCRIGCRSGKHSEGYAKCVSGYCQGSPISVLGNFLQTPTTRLVHFTHYPFWENSCKRQQQINFTHFGKVLANANQKYQFISRQIHFRSLEGQSKKNSGCLLSIIFAQMEKRTVSKYEEMALVPIQKPRDWRLAHKTKTYVFSQIQP